MPDDKKRPAGLGIDLSVVAGGSTYEALQRIMNPPHLRALHDMHAQLAVALSPLDQVLKHHDALRALAQPIQAFANSSDSLLKSYAMLTNALAVPSEMYKPIAALSQFQLGAFHGIESIAGAIARASASERAFARFSTTFAGALLGQIDGIRTAPDEENVEKRLDELAESFQSLAGRLPKSPISQEGLLNLVLTILLFLFQVLQARQSDRDNYAHIEQIGRRLLSAMPQSVETSSEELCLVTKALRLRDQPTRRGKIMGVLRPNTILSIHGRDGNWRNVKYFDHVRGMVRTGWVYSRGLCALEKSE